MSESNKELNGCIESNKILVSKVERLKEEKAELIEIIRQITYPSNMDERLKKYYEVKP